VKHKSQKACEIARIPKAISFVGVSESHIFPMFSELDNLAEFSSLC